ncbi:MAG: hypothetical protein GY737_00185 [Desulfobacteraceae bacterium]|nr:hypothetical protein [Desulfobacteraceae bacterium]
MSDKQHTVSFQFSLNYRESYDNHKVIGVNFSEDAVPKGMNPVEYLRQRVMEELDKRTLANPPALTTKLNVVEIVSWSPPEERVAEEHTEDSVPF